MAANHVTRTWEGKNLLLPEIFAQELDQKLADFVVDEPKPKKLPDPEPIPEPTVPKKTFGKKSKKKGK